MIASPNGSSLPHGSSLFHEENFDLEDVAPDVLGRGLKHDRPWWNQDGDDSSKEEEDPEEMEEDEDEPEEEANGKGQVESLKHINSSSPAPARRGPTVLWMATPSIDRSWKSDP